MPYIQNLACYNYIVMRLAKYMVNTVGSCENKHWQKKWILIKDQVTISPTQRSFIIGSLLGDGTMRMGKNAVNANFKVEQGLVQKEYVVWKYEILKPLVFTEPKISYRYTAEKVKYPKSWWFRTIRHPLLTEIYDTFYIRNGYKTGRKIIPKNIIDLLDPLGLAVWIMDDGSYNKGCIDISTYSFLLSEIKLLQNTLRKKFNVDILYYKDRDKGYRMYCNMKETKKLIQTIKPYIIQTMMYKIGLHNPVTTGSESVKTDEVKMVGALV
jgi:LAGLIDADG DNA endonuclease family